MYSIDPNINAAVERQAERMHAVRAINSSQFAQPTEDTQTTSQSPRQWNAAKAVLALSAAVPMIVVVWGLLAR